MDLELLGELGSVFDWQPDPAQYLPTPASELVRHGLRRSLEAGRGVVVLTGAAGAGKTLLLQRVLLDMPGRWPHLAQLAYTSMDGAEILRSMAYAFGMPADTPTHGSAAVAWTESRLRHWAAAGEASLLVVDEAQHLPLDALGPLLALSRLQQDGRPLLRMLLAGRPPLLERLAALASPGAAADIGPQFALSAFQPQESAAFIAQRLAALPSPGRLTLSAPVVAAIHARAQGRPGQIKLLCKQLLQTSILLDEDRPIDVQAVAEQADELGFHAEVLEPTAPADLPPPVPPSPPVQPTQPAQAPVTARTSRTLPLSIVLMLLTLAAGAALWLRHEAVPLAIRAPLPVPAAVSASALPAAAPPAGTGAQAGAEAATEATTPPPPRTSQPPESAPPTPPAQRQPARPVPPPTRLAANRHPAAPEPPTKTESPNCGHLLTQLSLGEPLTARQQRTLESTCR
ncbi:hypothetical protein RD110_09230 [Rhodoferax koreense]|uniref:ORC1/DEAH AAA+ ATPase domain-containing protein n=1 Tax=Rhodoferax koreensis TaxID=1842727 RepID=A0A1P8JUI1_9BURK|nr:ATP-binding protein [Rhodoferax koreense]APW37351.1 hypothetical protein RD110_09230 [Rhodoferax koreense]